MMTPHAAIMERMYRQQRHIYDVTRRYYLLGRDRLIAEMTPPAGSKVLEIGCGTGRNLIQAARLYPASVFFGIDISTGMLETARRAGTKAGFQNKIMYGLGDATNFDPRPLFDTDEFDCIFMSYTLSMIPAWQSAINHALGLLAPGGTLHIVDFGQQQDMPVAFRRALFTWLDWFHVTPRADIRQTLEDAAARHQYDLICRDLYRGYAFTAKLSRSKGLETV